MPLFITGISHHTAPIEVRERVAITRDDLERRAGELHALPGVEEVAILGTCNRTEIYCLSSSDGRRAVKDWLHRINRFEPGELERHLYDFQGEDAVRHLVRVASGLDSLVLGETQILGQMKDAWQQAHGANSLGKVLDRLFQHTFAAAKSIRTTTGIGEHPVSVAYTAVVLARQIFGNLESQTVMLLGAGEMIELCGRHLRDQGVSRLKIVNRSLDRAQALAGELGADAASLDQLEDILPQADILISSTASPVPVITRDQAKAALRKRRHRPMFMVDIAVPRDIEPGVARLNDIYLYTIDDLQQVVDENLQQRSAAAEQADEAVDAAVAGFMKWLYGMRAARTLKRMREATRDLQQGEIERALRRLDAGQDPGEVLEQMANRLSNKILHGPSKKLREAAENQQHDMLRAADALFRPGQADEDEA
jgi:glutamyl-tRNA reductase